MRYWIVVGMLALMPAGNAFAQATKSCSDLKAQCDAWCNGPKMDTTSRHHCIDHSKQSFDACIKQGTWETFRPTSGRWCDAGKVTGLTKQ